MALNTDNNPPTRTACRVETEIAEYPDSQKVGVLVGFSVEGDGKPTVMRYIIRHQAGMAEYWEGE